MRRARPGLLFILAHAIAAAQQSALAPAAQQAGRIAELGWFFIALLGLIFVIVMAFLGGALSRRDPGRVIPEPAHSGPPEIEQKLKLRVTGATVLTIAILFLILVLSVSTGKAISNVSRPQNSLVVEVTGNQWWWQIRYYNSDASQTFATANEIHVPLGQPVMIRGLASDVIHSFWAPPMDGKVDLIPSRVTTEWFQADRPGRFRGQCAEFCGLQHAHMALWIVAEPPEQFNDWYQRQLQPAAMPGDPEKQHGQQVFLTHACVFCHTISGTPAAGTVGPDLTHLASRMTIAAGTLPNTKGNLGGWIADPQRVKPGNHMATVPLSREDVEPLLDYLGSLQ